MTSFKDWLDERNISPEEAAEMFGKSVGTIRNWRSAGVPDLVRPWVEQRMSELNPSDPPEPSLDRIILEITNEQFQNWNEAALGEGLLLKDWAIQTLDEALADSTGSGEAPDPLRSIALVSDDRVDYKATKKERGA
jgi:hypothetical protein